MMLPENHIFGDGKVADTPVTYSFLRDTGKHAVNKVTWRKIGDIFSLKKNLPLCRESQTGNNLRQFTLSDPGYAGDSEIFPRVYFEVDIAWFLRAAVARD